MVLGEKHGTNYLPYTINHCTLALLQTWLLRGTAIGNDYNLEEHIEYCLLV